MNKLSGRTVCSGLAVLSVTIMLMLASCGSNLPRLSRDKPVSLGIWHHYLGEQKVMFDRMVAEFNSTMGAQMGITVKAYSMDNTGDIHNKLMASATGEPGSLEFPDMATAYPGTAFTLYKMGKLAPIDHYMTEEELNKYVPGFLEEGRLTADSGTVIFPVVKSTEVLYINYTFYTEFLDAYNMSTDNKLSEDMLSTFEGIRKTAEAYYEWTDARTPDIPNDGRALYGFDAASNFAVIGFRQLGSDFFAVNGDNTGDIDFNNPDMEAIWKEYYEPMVKGWYGAYSFYRSEDVQTGDLVMYVGSTAGAGFFPQTVTFADNTKRDIELKALPYPVLENGKNAAVQQGAGVIVTKSEPFKEYASVVFLKWLTEPERNTDFVLKTGYLPVTKEATDKLLPEILSEYESNPEYRNVLKVIRTTLDMLKKYELYTYKPFDSSDDIRYSFEDKLISFTKDAREEFLSTLKNGADSDKDSAGIVSDRRFDQFITEVRNEVLKVK